MAYRRRQGISRASTFKEEIYTPPDLGSSSSSSSTPSSSLAAQAIRASAAHRDSSLSSAYGDSAFHSSFNDRSKDSSTYDYTSMKSLNEPKGFWGVLAKKAKEILEDEDAPQQFETPSRMRPEMLNTSTRQSPEGSRKMDNPRLRKGLDALTSSLNHIGDTIGNALEEGRTIVENRTADIIQETRKLQIRRKGSIFEEQNQVPGVHNQWHQPSVQPRQPQMQTNQETQLKASRDVAMATAAKAKLLLRELKTVKADLAFAKERCSQLEEENKILREAREKGVNPEDDDMIRLQLETLLAEKARLAHENSVYARENRFLREIVEYHQLTMQDVVYLDEGIEEVTEVYPIPAVSRMLSVTPPSPTSPRSPPEVSPSRSPPVKNETFPLPVPLQATEVSPSRSTPVTNETFPLPVPLQVGTEVSPSRNRSTSVTNETFPLPVPLQATTGVSPSRTRSPPVTSETFPPPVSPQPIADVPNIEASTNSSTPISSAEDSTRHTNDPAH
ncbi:uncharacterized protein LOC132284615 isoform X2 [Cornus florida]|uniref:uncharacterized protein LOC132284615 isoform X2 n=1 Tax=Cornus florida TaxID=4283 RepID=UPI0028A1E13D|nr:uncharacterized protein LOC132284615 isoform X2 [Cornus florida]